MNIEHPATTSIGRTFLAAIVCTMAIVGCTGKHAGNEKEHSTADSAKGVDSTLQAEVAQPERDLSYEEQQGSFLFIKYCAICHGQEGKGDGFNAFNLNPRPRDFSDSAYMRALSEDQVVQTISGGGRSVNKSHLMPAYGWTLNKQQVRNIASYVRTIAGQNP